MNAPDLAQARRFLELLDPGAEAFTFQTFDDDEGLKRGHLAARQPRGADIPPGHVEQEPCRHLRHYQRDRSVGPQGTEHQAGAGAFVDLDGSPLQPVSARRLEPHVIVESSPGRWHAYWLVEGLPLEQFRPVQQAIIARFNDDKAIHDLPRVMRLLGFWHRKAEPFLVRIAQVSERLPYTAAEILAEFSPVASSGNGYATAPEEWQAIALQGVDLGARNSTITRVAGLLFRRLPDPTLAGELGRLLQPRQGPSAARRRRAEAHAGLPSRRKRCGAGGSHDDR